MLINLTEINSEINKLNDLISEYEDVQLNIFNQLKDSSVNWNDGNSLVFNEKIYDDKIESALFLLYIKENKELFDFIYNSYSQLGKKISCNLEKKNSVIFSIETCISQINTILNEFNQIDVSFNYSEKDNILKQKQKIVEVRQICLEIKNNTLKTYTKIEKIEKEVLKRTQKLEKFDIKEFDYELL